MPPKATQKIRNKSQVRSNPYPNSSQSRSASPLSRELRSLDRSASPLNSSRPGTFTDQDLQTHSQTHSQTLADVVVEVGEEVVAVVELQLMY